MSSPEGKREYFYDRAGRLVSEKLNGEIDVEYKYGYLDKVIEVNRRGKITKFAYDGFGMLAQKTFHDGSTEVWVWDGLALIRRGSDIYVNEPHVSGGVPILSKTDEGVRYHEHDFLGTTLWSTDTKGNLVKDYQDTTIFGEGSIQHDRSARFTGKPYDEDLQAYVFPYRNYDASTARWRSSDPAGYPDGINNQFYAAVPTYGLDILGLEIISLDATINNAIITIRNSNYGKDTNSVFYKMDNLNYNIEIKSGNKSIFYHDTGEIYVSASGDGLFAARDSNGNLTNSNGSLESKIIHELTHKSEYNRNPNKFMNDRETPGEMGSSLTEDNAIKEANKYRQEKGESIRIWYRDYNDYMANHEK